MKTAQKYWEEVVEGLELFAEVSADGGDEDGMATAMITATIKDYGDAREREARDGERKMAAPELLAMLKRVLPYLEHSVKFYRFQSAGHEFWPNREEIERIISETEQTIAEEE